MAFVSPTGEVDSVRTTGWHKFYRQDDQAWVSAVDLAAGDTLLGVDGPLVVESLHRVPGTHRVYNLTVEGEHVYRVAALGALVHNTDCAPKTQAQLNREASLAKGVPEHEIGPSGLPKIHTPKHSTLKKAKEAARRRVGQGGTTVKHPTPKVGNPHFHGVKPDGTKIRIHDEFPKVD